MPMPRPRPRRWPTSIPTAYRPFNLIVADNRDAFWLRHAGGLPSFAFRDPQRRLARGRADPAAGRGAAAAARPRCAGADRVPAAPGRPARCSPRASSTIRPRRASRHYLPRFERAAPPDPGTDDWARLDRLLGRPRRGADGDPRDAMAIVTGGDYGTVCSSLVALPGVRHADHEVRGRHARSGALRDGRA